jgi:hypothetical protein
MSAGSVLQSLAHPRDAAAWYGRAMQLADLIAAEDHSLQLYTLLHRYVSYRVTDCDCCNVWENQ